MKATIVFEKNWNAIHAVNPDGSRKYRYIINEGSSRSSKTISLIDCYDLYCRANQNKRATVWRDTKTDCKKTVLNDALKHLKKTGRYKVDQDFNKTESIFTYTSGSTFEVHGTDDEETLHGLTQDAAWLNEPYKISKETFDQIDQRTSDFMIVDWNPKKSQTWLENLKKDPRTIVIHSTFKDNPFCPEESRIKILAYQPIEFCELVMNKQLEHEQAMNYDLVKNPKRFNEDQLTELSRCRENEHKSSANTFNWQVYGLGLKSEKPNRIFKWTEINIEQYNDIDSKTYIGCDWGAVDPWGILEVKYYDGAVYLRELNYLSENEIRDKLSMSEISQIMGEDEGLVNWLFNRLNISKSSPVICDSNRPTKIAALRRSGWYAEPAAKGPGSILDGIDLMLDLKIYYVGENIGYEQENYSRSVDRSGYKLDEPEDLNNHMIDPARYVIQYLQAEGIIDKV